MQTGNGNTTSRVVQNLKGTSLRSFRVTDTLRRLNRYSVFSDKKINEVGFPSDLNELRSYIYTFSVINNDLRAFVPAPFLNNLSRKALSVGKTIGDFNAVQNTLLRVVDQKGMAGIGERALRRVGGKLSGKLLSTVIPSGGDVFSRAMFRGIRSAAGANLTIEMDRYLKKAKGQNSDVAMLSADFSRLIKRGEVNAEVVSNYIYKQVEAATPVDSGALIDTLYMRKGRKSKNAVKTPPDYIVGIGNVNPMPDPNVPYPWVIEFGINKGYGYHYNPQVDLYFPIPRRFKFLQSVTGPRPAGDNFYGGFYNNDNRSPYDRSDKNRGKGAMVRTALMSVLQEGRKRKTYNTGIPKYKTNPFKEVVWDQATKNMNSTRNYDTPF